MIESGERVALVGYGYGAVARARGRRAVEEAIGARPTVVNARFCKPIDAKLMRQLADRHELLVTIEDHAQLAGFGSAVLEVLEGAPARVLRLGDARPFRRPRQARAAARRGGPLARAGRRAVGRDAALAGAHARRRELRPGPPRGRRRPGYHRDVARSRLDVALVERGLFPSRSRAQAAVMAGQGAASTAARPTSRAPAWPRTPTSPWRRAAEYVSRGGIKLANALDALGVDVRGACAIDLGRLHRRLHRLPAAARRRRVIALDVGYGQLDWGLRQDPRVHVMERTNARDLGPGRPALRRRTSSPVTSPSSRSARSGARCAAVSRPGGVRW